MASPDRAIRGLHHGNDGPRDMVLNDSPAKIGRYVIEGRLGEGGMGVVYRARDPVLMRLVALKTLRPGAMGPVQLQRFLREAGAAGRLRHPNIVPVHEVFESDGLPYIVLDYIEGTTLDEWLKRTPRTALAVTELMSQVARAVHHAHEHGIVHRDLKPENILVDASSRAFVTDFGLAQELESQETDPVTKKGQLVGTPLYMAPEQALGDSSETSPATDVHALGVVLYLGLTGRTPFDTPNLRALLISIIEDPPAPLRTIVPDLPERLDACVLRCLAKKPADRWPSALAVAQELEGLGKPEAARSSRKRIVLFAAALALATGVGMAVVKIRDARIRAEEERKAEVRRKDEELRQAEALRKLALEQEMIAAAKKRIADAERTAKADVDEGHRETTQAPLRKRYMGEAAADLTRKDLSRRDQFLASIDNLTAAAEMITRKTPRSDTVDIYSRRADCFTAVGSYTEALRDVESALEVSPTAGAALLAKSKIYRALNDPAQELAALDAWVMGGQDHSIALLCRNRFYAHHGRRQDALADLDKLIELNPEAPEAYIDRAALCLAEGRLPEAREAADQAVAHAMSGPKRGDALAGRLDVTVATKDWTAAAADAKCLIELRHWGSDWLTLAQACEGLGDLPQARDAAQKALALGAQKVAAARLLLARVALANKSWDETLKHGRAALARGDATPEEEAEIRELIRLATEGRSRDAQDK